MIPKATRIESQPMRKAAKGEQCTLQILGVCNGRTDTTVLAHLPDESHGMSRKSDDISAVFACHACHDCIDGRINFPDAELPLSEWYFRRAQTRTWRRLVALGIVTIKGAL